MDQHNHNHKHDKPEHSHGHHGDAEKKHPQSPEPNAAPQPGEEATMASPGADEQRKKDREKIEELESKVGAANDKYLRLMAEFDNYKRRTYKENQQVVEQANEKLIKDIIDVREGFERAFKSHTEGADEQPFMDGMKMLFAKLDGVLHKHGLEVYCEPGQEFDPQLHDAMMKSAHDHIPEHHIAEVLEKGYKLRGKVIKHSRVIVSSGKPAPSGSGQPQTGGDAETKAAFEAESAQDAEGTSCD